MRLPKLTSPNILHALRQLGGAADPPAIRRTMGWPLPAFPCQGDPLVILLEQMRSRGELALVWGGSDNTLGLYTIP